MTGFSVGASEKSVGMVESMQWEYTFFHENVCAFFFLVFIMTVWCSSDCVCKCTRSGGCLNVRGVHVILVRASYNVGTQLCKPVK